MGLQDSRKRTHKEVVTVQLVLCQGTVLALGWKQVAACVGGEGSQKTLQCGRVGDGGEGEEACQEGIPAEWRSPNSYNTYIVILFCFSS